MVDATQLPFLVRLLDDESPTVHAAVMRELRGYGPALEQDLFRLPGRMEPAQWNAVKDIVAVHRRNWLKEEWPKWFDIQDEYYKLEVALDLIAEFQKGPTTNHHKLGDMLDELANEFLMSTFHVDVFKLSQFLFRQKKFSGAQNDYHNPQNSNLAYVIEKRQGIPISLVALFMLIGHRLGLRIEGCNFPAHFLAKIPVGNGDSILLVDCYNGGRIIDDEALVLSNPDLKKAIHDLLYAYTDATTIISRTLRNLLRAYHQQEQLENCQLMLDLLKDTQRQIREDWQFQAGDPLPLETRALYQPGQTVYHKKHGYRGVVVDFDLICQANDIWYYSNHSQPPRQQPWYHLLVNQTDQNTYVAQSSLIPDNSGSKIEHPLLNYFFNSFTKGVYVRNSQPWTL